MKHFGKCWKLEKLLKQGSRYPQRPEAERKEHTEADYTVPRANIQLWKDKTRVLFFSYST